MRTGILGCISTLLNFRNAHVTLRCEVGDFRIHTNASKIECAFTFALSLLMRILHFLYSSYKLRVTFPVRDIMFRTWRFHGALHSAVSYESHDDTTHKTLSTHNMALHLVQISALNCIQQLWIMFCLHNNLQKNFRNKLLQLEVIFSFRLQISIPMIS
jgi:hypothetical protein